LLDEWVAGFATTPAGNIGINQHAAGSMLFDDVR
jgi:hypothetical protein